jgi:hypothetical protein
MLQKPGRASFHSQDSARTGNVPRTDLIEWNKQNTAPKGQRWNISLYLSPTLISSGQKHKTFSSKIENTRSEHCLVQNGKISPQHRCMCCPSVETVQSFGLSVLFVGILSPSFSLACFELWCTGVVLRWIVVVVLWWNMWVAWKKRTEMILNK